MSKNKKGRDDFAKFSREKEEVSAVGGGGSPDVTPSDPPGDEGAGPEASFEIAADVPEVVSPREANAGAGECCTTFHTGKELPGVTPREGTHPLLVESYKMLRKIVAGGLLTPWARGILTSVDSLVARLRREVEGEEYPRRGQSPVVHDDATGRDSGDRAPAVQTSG